jgi:hypothetical protein
VSADVVVKFPGAVPQPAGNASGAAPSVAEFLSIATWCVRDIPEPERLLGDVVTNTSRMFLVGKTGLGKTMLGIGLAVGMAAGTGFCHWRSERPAKVLYIDGEMPADLIKSRSIDAVRRSGPIPPDNLCIFALDMAEQFAKAYPALPPFAPLNTPEGQAFVFALIEVLGGVDVVIFDNVMSLISGDQKDEVPWSETLALVAGLTTKRIGQIWLDHTGHNTDRQYGSSTKAWRFDSVAVMTAPPDDQLEPDEVGFTLTFNKARRRKPENWRDFETVVMRLSDDSWTSKSSDAGKASGGAVKLSPMAREFYAALKDAPRAPRAPTRTTRTDWYAECVRLGLAEAIEPDDDHRERSAKQAKFRKYVGEFKAAGLIGVNGEEINDLAKDV